MNYNIHASEATKSEITQTQLDEERKPTSTSEAKAPAPDAVNAKAKSEEPKVTEETEDDEEEIEEVEEPKIKQVQEPPKVLITRDTPYPKDALRHWKPVPNQTPSDDNSPGAMGSAVILTDDKIQETYKINEFNMAASDLIPLNRSLPDYRLEE